MNKLIKVFAVNLMAMAFVVSTATAGGLSIGLKGTSMDFTTDGSEEEGILGANDGSVKTFDFDSTSISKSVDVGSVFVEYTWGDGLLGSTIGIDYIPGGHTIGAKTRSDSNGEGDTGDYTAEAEVQDHVTVYFEPMLNATDMFGIYGKVGAIHLTVNSLENLTPATPSSDDTADSVYGNKSIMGYVIGAGVRLQTQMGLFAKLEATHSDYGTVELSSTTGNGNIIRAYPEADNVSLAIGFNF